MTVFHTHFLHSTMGMLHLKFGQETWRRKHLENLGIDFMININVSWRNTIRECRLDSFGL